MQPSSVSALVAQRRAALAQRMPVWQRLTMGDWFDRLAAEFAEREHIYTPEKSTPMRSRARLPIASPKA